MKKQEYSTAIKWHLLVLLFVIALINYFDRQSLSVLAPRVQAALHLSDTSYGHVVSGFLLASAIAYAGAGYLSDRLGIRRSMALFVGWWSLAEAATAFVRTGFGLTITRFMLGLGEPGLWVAAPKAVGEYFKREKRATAIGVYTAGATVGAIAALPSITWLSAHFPWKVVFLVDGAAGLLWLPFWFHFYACSQREKTATENLQACSSEEVPANPKGSFRIVLMQRNTWRLILARGITDPVWYFYLFWFPKYLFDARHFAMERVAQVGWIVYLAAGIGTLLGGSVSHLWVRQGLDTKYAYRKTMLLCACLVPLTPLISFVSPNLAIFVSGLATFAHMCWLVNLTAFILELFPSWQVGTAAGMIAAGSGLGGMLSSEVIGYLVVHHGYASIFSIMALLHPLAFVLIHPLATSNFTVKTVNNSTERANV